AGRAVSHCRNRQWRGGRCSAIHPHRISERRAADRAGRDRRRWHLDNRANRLHGVYQHRQRHRDRGDRSVTRRNISEIELQIMWNRLLSVVEEQARALVRTAFSTSASEAGDISAGVFDLEGRMLAQAVTGTPGHVNSMARSVIHFIREFPVETMKPGDAYVTNDPWKGTGHLYDIVVTSPAFHNGKLVA